MLADDRRKKRPITHRQRLRRDDLVERRVLVLRGHRPSGEGSGARRRSIRVRERRRRRRRSSRHRRRAPSAQCHRRRVWRSPGASPSCSLMLRQGRGSCRRRRRRSDARGTHRWWWENKKSSSFLFSLSLERQANKKKVLTPSTPTRKRKRKKLECTRRMPFAPGSGPGCCGLLLCDQR